MKQKKINLKALHEINEYPYHEKKKWCIIYTYKNLYGVDDIVWEYHRTFIRCYLRYLKFKNRNIQRIEIKKNNETIFKKTPNKKSRYDISW